MRRIAFKLFLTFAAVSMIAPMSGCVVDDILTEIRTTNDQLVIIGRRLNEIDSNLIAIDRNLIRIDGQLQDVSIRLDTVDAKLGSLDTKLASIDADLDSTNQSLSSLRRTISNIDRTIPFLKFSGDDEEEEGGEADAEGVIVVPLDEGDVERLEGDPEGEATEEETGGQTPSDPEPTTPEEPSR